MNKTNKTEEDWKEKLTEEEYRILREKGTEAPFTGKYVHTKDKGVYKCAACGNQLFSSETKFDSGTGWPSFTDPMNLGNVELKEDRSHGTHLPAFEAAGNGGQVIRTEVLCKKCGSHLGHVFDDLPAEVLAKAGGQARRYCINSVCLQLEKDPSASSG